MDYLRRFQASMNDQEEDIEAQESWDERPWRWVPTALQLPAATIGGIYRNLSVSKKKDPTLRKDSSFQEMPRTKKTLKKRVPRVKKGKKKVKKVLIRTKKTQLKKRGGAKPRRNYPGIDYQRTVASGSTVRFSAGRASGCLRMHLRTRLGQLVYDNVHFEQQGGSTAFPCLAIDFDAGLPDTVLPMNPMLAGYFSDPLKSLVQPFNLFNFESAKILYMTSSPTAVNGKLVMAYADDVRYLDSRGYTGTLKYIGEFDLVRFSNSVTTPLYENCSFQIPLNHAKKYYFLRSIYGNTVSNFSLNGTIAADAAEDRDCMQGCFIVSGTYPTGTTVNGTQFGDIYLETTIELCDVSAVVTSPVSLLTEEEKRLSKFKNMLDRVMANSRVVPGTISYEDLHRRDDHGYTSFVSARSSSTERKKE